MKLYDFPLSANAHKVRVLLSILGIEHETVTVDLRAGEQRSDWFRALNPRGQVPVLEDEGLVIWDSSAILAYLARKAGATDWLPAEPAALAQIVQWFAFSTYDIRLGPNEARLIEVFGVPGDFERAQAASTKALSVLEGHLDGREWLVGSGPTVADLACLPYVALAPESGIPLDAYPAVRAWVARVEALPGYIPMPRP